MTFRGLPWFLLAQVGAMIAFGLWAWMVFDGRMQGVLMIALPLAVVGFWTVLLTRPVGSKIHAHPLRLTAAGVGLVGALALAVAVSWKFAFFQALVSVLGLFSEDDPQEYEARIGYLS